MELLSFEKPYGTLLAEFIKLGEWRTGYDDVWSVITILRGSSRTIWREKKVSEQEFRRPHHNHLTSINAEIDHRVDGNVLVARELTNALLTKICWGILTP
mgnify:CR=1 FL=1